MRLTLFEPARPREENIFPKPAAELYPVWLRRCPVHAWRVLVQKTHQNVLLLLTQPAGLKSRGLERFGFLTLSTEYPTALSR